MKNKISLIAIFSLLSAFSFADKEQRLEQKQEGMIQTLPRTLIIKVKANDVGEDVEAACVASNFNKIVSNEQLAMQAIDSIRGVTPVSIREESKIQNASKELDILFQLHDLIAFEPLEKSSERDSADAPNSWRFSGPNGFYGYGYRGNYGYGNPWNYRHANYGYYWNHYLYPYVRSAYSYPYGGYNYYYYNNPYYPW